VAQNTTREAKVEFRTAVTEEKLLRNFFSWIPSVQW